MWSPSTRPMNTSATMRPPTGPSLLPPAITSASLRTYNHRGVELSNPNGSRSDRSCRLSSSTFIAFATRWPDGNPKVRWRSRLRCARDCGSFDGIESSANSGLESLVSICLLGFGRSEVLVGLRRGADVEEGPPVDEPPRSALAAGQVVRIGYAVVQLGVEDVFQERVAVVPVKVGYVARPNLAVAKPVCGHRKLDRNKGFVAPRVELAALLEDIFHQALPNCRRQKLV